MDLGLGAYPNAGGQAGRPHRGASPQIEGAAAGCYILLFRTNNPVQFTFT